MYREIINNIQFHQGVKDAEALPKHWEECQDLPRLPTEMEEEHPPFAGGAIKGTFAWSDLEETRANAIVQVGIGMSAVSEEDWFLD